MKKHIAKLLRRQADKLDPPPPCNVSTVWVDGVPVTTTTPASVAWWYSQAS